MLLPVAAAFGMLAARVGEFTLAASSLSSQRGRSNFGRSPRSNFGRSRNGRSPRGRSPWTRSPGSPLRSRSRGREKRGRSSPPRSSRWRSKRGLSKSRPCDRDRHGRNPRPSATAWIRHAAAGRQNPCAGRTHRPASQSVRRVGPLLAIAFARRVRFPVAEFPVLKPPRRAGIVAVAGVALGPFGRSPRPPRRRSRRLETRFSPPPRSSRSRRDGRSSPPKRFGPPVAALVTVAACLLPRGGGRDVLTVAGNAACRRHLQTSSAESRVWQILVRPAWLAPSGPCRRTGRSRLPRESLFLSLSRGMNGLARTLNWGARAAGRTRPEYEKRHPGEATSRSSCR